MKQPLGIVAVLYAGGVLLGNYFQLPLPCMVATSLALAAGALLLPGFRRSLILVFIVFGGWANFVGHSTIVSPTDLRVILANEPQLVTVRGTLVETPTARYYTDPASGNSFSTTARIRMIAIQRGTNWQPASGQIVASVPDRLSENFLKNREVQVYGVIGPPPRPIAEGLFDFREFLRRQEIYFRLKTARPNDWQLADSRNLSPPLSDRFRKWAEAALALGQPEDDKSVRLQQALSLGDKTFLTDEATEPFVRAATYHIFAVDGLRLAILFSIFLVSLRALRVPRMICGIVLLPLIWSYVALTGWPASAIRAAVMLTIIVGGWALRRPVDVLNSLFAAALIILIWQPQQLFQAGFQLSFFVVLFILLIMPFFDGCVQRLLKSDPLLPDDLRPRWQRMLHTPLRCALGLLFSSFAAWLGSIPLVAYYFHIVTPVSTVANVLAVPLCILVLTSNLISLVLAGWFPSGAVVLNYAGTHLMNWIRASSIWFAGLPGAYAYMQAPNLFTIGLFYLILLAIATGWLFKVDGRKWKFAALIFLVAAWCGQWWFGQSATRLTILPLNGGSVIYCDAPGNGNDLLVDCGSERSFAPVLKPYLQAQGVNSLPRLVLTHGSEGQVGGFKNLEAEVAIKKVVTSPARFRSPVYREAIELLKTTAGRQQVVSGGDEFSNWTVLHPVSTNSFSHAEDNPLVLRGAFPGVRVLLLSNLGRQGQEALLERGADLRADIVVAGLPGENEPLKDALLEAIQPRLIVIADSESPVNRRAGRVLRARLEKRGIPVLYTSELGAVKISLRGNRWEADTLDGWRWP
ncbi:MAG TPA: ComEC/Rec2 family competence protein [Verrucomicrobiae bacterium]|jgi:competence protein ComEC|nr:ComEC/Rec2 family competence protein [Verrucomicrobiae bacterium]